MLDRTYPYELPPLPYAYDALEPYIDRETLHYHHDKHFQAYITKLNDALTAYPLLQRLTLRQLLSGQYPLPGAVRSAILHNGGGVYNHDLYFKGLTPAEGKSRTPEGRTRSLINMAFGTFDSFRQAFDRQALAVFGSGWTFLVLDRRGMLHIVSLKDQETLIPLHQTPLVILDVWEHAYYLQYKNDRAAYIDAFWQVVRFPEL